MELGERIAYVNVPVVKRESIYLKTKKKTSRRIFVAAAEGSCVNYVRGGKTFARRAKD